MIRTYRIENTDIEFDDVKTIHELIAYAFDILDYYEPAGMDIVTLFQCHHSNQNCGWFTTDTEKTCRDEIENTTGLTFGYHKPGVFYFAEGGWGHHMTELGNHPLLKNPTPIKLQFKDFRNTVVINGDYCFNDILNYLKRTGYIPADLRSIEVIPVSTGFSNSFKIDCSDERMNLKLSEFVQEIERYSIRNFSIREGFLYYPEFRLE